MLVYCLVVVRLLVTLFNNSVVCLVLDLCYLILLLFDCWFWFDSVRLLWLFVLGFGLLWWFMICCFVCFGCYFYLLFGCCLICYCDCWCFLVGFCWMCFTWCLCYWFGYVCFRFSWLVWFALLLIMVAIGCIVVCLMLCWMFAVLVWFGVIVGFMIALFWLLCWY